MTSTNPYSYVSSGGVENARVRVAEDATLDDLAEAFKDPMQLDVPSIKYHNMPKRERNACKRQLWYFVGGVIKGRRHDTNVQSRTFLTLDVEQGPKDDSPPPDPRKVKEHLEQLGGAGWIYTSLSHTPDSPRYRVVLPLGHPITGTSEEMQAALQASTLHAAKTLGIDAWTKPESWVLSQPMYLPAALKGARVYQALCAGNHWRVVRRVSGNDTGGVHGSDASTVGDTDRSSRHGKVPADIPDERPDEVLTAIKAAGLYIKENPRHPGMHFIVCPFLDQHGTENDSQTVYYEAHYDGNPRAAVKCFDTDPDTDGVPHLTYAKLVRYLREQGHLTQDQQEKAGVLDDDDTFIGKADLSTFLATEPTARTWAIENFAPVGKVTVIGGPGGVSKSMLVLHMLMYTALGKRFGPFGADVPLKSLYVSYEDDRQEMHKRVFTLVEALRELDDGVFDMLYDIKGTLKKNLLMYAADDDAASWLILTKPDRYAPPERSARVEWLVGFLRRNKVRTLVLDPAVYTHQLEENNIADMAVYMQTLTAVAKQANCAVVVLHHMSKTAGWLSLDDINQSSLRGASSFADNARSVGVVVSMPIKDAPNYGLPAEQDTTSRYAVFKHVKHNYSASLGTHIFERKGPLLMPRPDITKLDHVQLQEARERQVQQSNEFRIISSAAAVLRFLREADGFVSLNQIVVGAHVHKRRARDLMEEYAQRDWVELEPGERGSVQIRATRAGLRWLKEREEQEHA